MTDKETIQWQRMEIEQLQYRLKMARSDRDKALDLIDKQQREALSRGMLEGPEYRFPSYCSDGRVWAHKADQAREETIRWFAGQALGCQGYSTSECLNVALHLWNDIERHFETERATRDAIESAKTEAEQDGEVEE